MLTRDSMAFTLHSLRAQRGRSLLTGLGIGMGIAAVVLLTSIGQGLQSYVLAEFTQFGTNLIGITPGKSTTHGMSGAMISNVRPLSLGDARALLKRRHGEEDFTLVTQDQMLDVLGNILEILTFAVGALGSISLLVGGVGILTIMSIAVAERRTEIGLLRALGAPRRLVLALFMGEAVLLSALGGGAGLGVGAGGAWLLGVLLPALPTHTSWGYALLALAVSALIGITAGAWPAYRASRLDPVASLSSE